MEHLGWSPVPQGLVGSLVVVEVEVGPEGLPGFSPAGIGLTVNLLRLPRPPQTLHHDVVLVPPLAVHIKGMGRVSMVCLLALSMPYGVPSRFSALIGILTPTFG